ncbi:YecH family protein [Vibrio sp. DW001]|uniref:YecH family metal-binding protein n=1 Tax=Vibrio sp. DW001 TaxID=2912315 RepID=UPI0023B10299|nr:YecH family metal-binding protein [Vibrio sp. DW001]WED26606.1 YecH family protein [Vibrio sp. DW001]
MNNIHGHKILDMLSEKFLTRDEVKNLLTNEYGDDVQFHTCLSEGLNFDELFDFFIEREKIATVDGKYSINATNKCE